MNLKNSLWSPRLDDRAIKNNRWNRDRRGVVAAMVLTAAAVLTSVALADPASAVSSCGTARTGHAGNTYQSCAASSTVGKLATTNVFKHGVGATVFQVGVQTNGGSVVWGLTGTVTATSSTVAATVGCASGSTVRAALRTKYGSVWDPTAYSAAVSCA
jgi:hypothetical protein